MVPTRANRDSEDPLSRAIRPPEDETPAQRAQRVQEEQEALRVSEEIDKELNRERAEKKKLKPEIKVLLLGPSGSGKSTTLKNFQLAFTPKALQAEAANYTALVYLNVVSSVRLLRDVLDVRDVEMPRVLYEHCSRLQPVVDLEPVLTKRFGDSLSVPSSPQSQSPTTPPGEEGRRPYDVNAGGGGVWRVLQSSARKALSSRNLSNTADIERAGRVLAERREDIEALARHPAVQSLLAARSQRLEHLPGYFLDDMGRITAPDYAPTDDDILRTRIRTVGVSEMRFTVESGTDKGQTWVVIDVGGARSQRAAWVPYFDDVNAIIFMAPVGQFDQFLEEDTSVNCLKDSLELWESIVSNKLLENAEFILFLNKFDMLSQKVNAGVNFSSFVTSYKDRNNAESVGKYLQKKFTAIHKQRSPKNRSLHCHLTSVTDKSSTVALITHFRLVVLRNHFRDTQLL